MFFLSLFFPSFFFGSVYLPFPFPPPRPPLRYFEKDSSPVDWEEIFRVEEDDHYQCEDLHGNKYQEGDTVTSCCECLM